MKPTAVIWLLKIDPQCGITVGNGIVFGYKFNSFIPFFLPIEHSLMEWKTVNLKVGMFDLKAADSDIPPLCKMIISLQKRTGIVRLCLKVALIIQYLCCWYVSLNYWASELLLWKVIVLDKQIQNKKLCSTQPFSFCHLKAILWSVGQVGVSRS